MRNERKNLQKQSDIAENTYEKEILEERILSLSKKSRVASDPKGVSLEPILQPSKCANARV